ncbi:MAG: HNH endonuclease family protein [Mycobacterium sp.]|nr:HNH endonuclease family protein [Mycobacterium sp.]
MAAGKSSKARRRGLAVVLAILVIAAIAGALYWQERSLRERTSGPSPTWRAEPTSTSASGPPPPPPPGDPSRFDTARQRLGQLEVRGWDRTSDFKRYRFGKAWSDDVDVEFGHNGCNTRDDILRRDLQNLVVRRGTCYAQSGTLVDPYSGVTIDFVRSPETSKAIEIDHVVALADAWYKGARSWDPQRRLDFANDPRNLLAVSPKANFDKAFRDAASWLPPNEAFRCDFVARQIEVKAAYGLWLAAKEKKAMEAVLARC